MKERRGGVTRAVDRDLARNQKPWSLYVPMLLLALAWLLATSGSVPGLLAGSMLAIVTIVWLVYALSRAWRVTRMLIRRMGEQPYDREGKYRLPPEYANTESASAARKQRRRLKSR